MISLQASSFLVSYKNELISDLIYAVSTSVKDKG